MRSKTIEFTCDICGNKVKETTSKLPIDWMTIVRKKKKRDVCVDCRKAIAELEKTMEKPF